VAAGLTESPRQGEMLYLEVTEKVAMPVHVEGKSIITPRCSLLILE
jgi:hypothetical protein